MKFLDWLFVPTEKEMMCEEIDLYSILLSMEKRIEALESENIELTNALYEFENRLQAQIDNIQPVVYNIQEHSTLKNFTLGDT
jgi:hypothetical protein